MCCQIHSERQRAEPRKDTFARVGGSPRSRLRFHELNFVFASDIHRNTTKATKSRKAAVRRRSLRFLLRHDTLDLISVSSAFSMYFLLPMSNVIRKSRVYKDDSLSDLHIIICGLVRIRDRVHWQTSGKSEQFRAIPEV